MPYRAVIEERTRRILFYDTGPAPGAGRSSFCIVERGDPPEAQARRAAEFWEAVGAARGDAEGAAR